jgi:hypothetical protein
MSFGERERELGGRERESQRKKEMHVNSVTTFGVALFTYAS